MTLNLDKDVMRKLWDNYYVPFLKVGSGPAAASAATT